MQAVLVSVPISVRFRFSRRGFYCEPQTNLSFSVCEANRTLVDCVLCVQESEHPPSATAKYPVVENHH